MQRLKWEQKVDYFRQLGYRPTGPKALEVHHSTSHRFLLAGGEDSGKSYITAKEMGPHVLYPPEIKGNKIVRPRYFAIAGPTYEEPRMEFGYLMEDLKEMGALDGKPSMPREGSWRMITGVGNIVESRTLEDAMNIRTWKPDGIAVVEAGKVTWPAVKRLQGRASARDAFWFMSGTFEQSERWYQQWFKIGQRPNDMRLESIAIPTYANEFNYPGGRENSVIQEMRRIYDDEYWQERIEAEPIAPHGLVLKGFKPHNVKESELNPNLPVYLWVDPGYDAAYAVEVFQIEGKTAYGIDEVYEHDRTTEEVIGICKTRPWWDCKKIATVDFAARQHQMGKSVQEQWWEYAHLRLTDLGKPILVKDMAERIITKLNAGEIFISPRQVGALAEADSGDPPWQGHRAWKHKVDHDGAIFDRNSTEGNRDAWMAIGYGLIRHFGYAPRLRDYRPTQYMPYTPEQYTNWNKEPMRIVV